MPVQIKYLVMTLFVCFVAMSVMALVSYQGSWLIFTLFCIVFLLLWTMAWIGYKSYFYMFFSTLSLLGFWMKACSHLITGRKFVEPIGAFDGSGDAWDKAIIVALVAGLGMLCFRSVQIFLMQKHKGVCVVKPDLFFVPYWYARFRKWIWFGTLIAVVFVTVVNFWFGINQSGLLPKHHFPFKLNAIIIWCLYSGFAFWMSALLWWDVCSGLTLRFEALIFEGLLSSVAIMSRSLYMTHIAHYLLSIIFNRFGIKLTLRKYISMSILFLVGMAIIMFSVAELRKDRFYIEANIESPVHSTERASPQFLLLLSERWIGLEGVMSTSSYPAIGIETFKQGWLDMPSYARKPVYERVANSIYISSSYKNADMYNFLSIPGFVAMLHLSGSLAVVGFGIFIVLVIFSLGEYLIFRGLQNPFILSLYGMIVAMMLHQFGGLYVNLIQLFEIGSMMLFLWAVKNVPDYLRSIKLVK